MSTPPLPEPDDERLQAGLKLLDSGLLAMLAPVEIGARTEHHLLTARYEGTGANTEAEPLSVTVWLDDPFAPLGRVVISSCGSEHDFRPATVEALAETFVELAQGSLLPLPSRNIDLGATAVPGATGFQLYGLEEGD